MRDRRLGLEGWAVLALLAVVLVPRADALDAVAGDRVADRSKDRSGSSRPTPSARAKRDIPSRYLARYRSAAGRCRGLSWTVLAAIGKVESDHGRTRLPGVRSGANRAGAAGPMQFGIGGKAGNTWGAYRVDGDRDGRASVYDADDAIPAAADYLCAHGAPKQLRRAIWHYNHSSAYVAKVFAIARRYAREPRSGGTR
jgi:hypothetical protein